MPRALRKLPVGRLLRKGAIVGVTGLALVKGGPVAARAVSKLARNAKRLRGAAPGAAEPVTPEEIQAAAQEVQAADAAARELAAQAAASSNPQERTTLQREAARQAGIADRIRDFVSDAANEVSYRAGQVGRAAGAAADAVENATRAGAHVERALDPAPAPDQRRQLLIGLGVAGGVGLVAVAATRGSKRRRK